MAACFTARMEAGRRLREVLGRAVLETRVAIGWSKDDLARRAGVSRAMVGHIETCRVNVTVDTAGRILDALGVQVEPTMRRPYVARSRQTDAGHARCVAYVQRRLQAAGWLVRREVEIVHGRSHGWIDVMAFNPETRVLLVIEVKTEIHDVGRIERTLGWYAREAWNEARRLGWGPRTVRPWLLILVSEENEDRLRANREAFGQSFPERAGAMLHDGHRAGLGLIDPRSRRRDWLLRARIDGRRTVAPYLGYADFLRRLDRA